MIEYDQVKDDVQADDPHKICLTFGDHNVCGKFRLTSPPNYNKSKLEYIKDFLMEMKDYELNGNKKVLWKDH